MRRSLFIFLVAALLVFAIYRWQRLNHVFSKAAHAERYTPASGPRIDLKDVQVLASLDAEYTRLVDAVVPSVVSITTSRRVQERPRIDPLELFFRNRRLQQAPRERVQTALGSGVVVSKEGHVITNHHVIADMEKIEVQLTDGRVEPARLIGTDELTDIAVLKIDAKNVEPLALGDSDKVKVGRLVFTIGNPFGLQETVTQGIISAKGRRAVADSGVEFFQTDAAVNQGNSGGPLLNLRGEIVGINSAIYSTSDTGAWLGISFAIPSNVARRALESLLKNGRIIRGYLGVNMVDVTPFFARQLNLSANSGALVADVMPGSPAEKAGMKRGDVIQRFNGNPIPDTRALRSRVAEADIGSNAELTLLREGKEVTITAIISEAPAEASAMPARPSPPRQP